MYIALNDERIIFNFDKGVTVRMSGPDSNYYVELREYNKNESNSFTVESYPITPDKGRNPYFWVPIEFYGDWQVSIYKFVDKVGLNLIYTHRFCDYGKLVRFNVETYNYKECLDWVSRVEEYVRIHGCIPLISTPFDNINTKYLTYYNVPTMDVYKTYNIGRFPKNSHDFRTLDHRKLGLMWFANWKTFWSYQHPRNWSELSSREIVDDILGLS